METTIKKAFIDSFNYLCSQVVNVPFRHINENVYRYFFIKHLPKNIGIEDEWHRIDLLLHDQNFQYPIEFKQYSTRPLLLLGKNKCGRKGGAGKKNFQEFLNSAKKLVEKREEPFYSRNNCNFKNSYFVLVAGDTAGEKGKNRFDYWYSDQNRHLDALLEIGIKSKVIAQKEFRSPSEKIFGWILEIWEN